jgi:hypothetical protein
MKGPLVAGDFVDIVNGQGMRIDQAFVGSLSHPINDTIGALSSSLLLNFTELPAYNRRNPIAAQFRFTRTNDPGLYQYVYGVGELVSCAGNGSIVANAERVGTQGILNGIPVPGGVGYYGSFGTRGHGAVDMPAVGTPSGYNLAQDRQVISIGGNAHGRGGWASIKQAKDAVVWPSLYDGYASGLLECPGSSTPSADIDLGFCFWVFNADGVNGFRPGVVLRAVRILQAGG